MKSFFSACTVFKTTSNAGLRHESKKSLAIRKRRFFRLTAQGSSFFNPSETRRVLNWLQSVFGARDQPGSLTASRRTTDGIPLHNEYISGTHNSILLSRSHKWSSRGYEKDRKSTRLNSSHQIISYA